jgi:hypothetical protein
MVMRDDNVVENEVVRRLEWLEKLKVDFAEKVAVAVEAFIASGSDLEAELDRQAGELSQEIVAECKAANARLWKKAKADHHQAPSWRRVVDPGRWGPRPTQNAVGPSIEAALKVSEKADFASGLEEAIKGGAGPEAEARAEPAREERFRLDEEPTTPVLSKAAPMDNAKSFARDRLRKGDVLATYYYHGDWWQWNGRFYEIAPADRIAGAVYTYLDRARTGEERFKPKPEHAEALIKCLKACIAIDDRDGPPRWLNHLQVNGPRAGNLLVFQNCLVDVETGEVVELTPQLWVHGGVDFEFEANARCPRWERFLEEVFPGDSESQMTIEEQLGYGMTNLQDAGGVLASRFIMLDFAQSFFGREDITLRTQLERELEVAVLCRS